MKLLKTCILTLALFTSAFATAGTLSGNDATELANLLKSSGMAEISDVTIAFVSAQNVFCVGENYVDQCNLTPADQMPAASAKEVPSDLTGQLWSLMKKSGIKNQISDISGSFGASFVSASRIDCSLNSANSNLNTCTITPGKP